MNCLTARPCLLRSRWGRIRLNRVIMNSSTDGSGNDKMYDRGQWKRFKYCLQCQRVFTERAKWKNNWDEVKYCSDKCRSESKKRKP